MTMHSDSVPRSEAAPAGVLRQIRDLPGPPALPVFGSLLQLRKPQVHQDVEAWSRQYGPYFRMRLGPTDFLVVSDHAAIAALLRDRPDGFRRPPRLELVWREMGLLPGVFGANGDAWRAQRRMVMAAFDPRHVRAYFPALVRVADRLGDRWRVAAQRGASIDLQADLMRFTVDAIAGLAFGTDINTLQSDEDVIQRHLDKIFPAVSRRMLSLFPYWRWLPLPADRQLARSVASVNAAVDGFIADARARMDADAGRRAQPPNLLEAMIAAADAPGSGVDDRDVAGNVLTMLLAGEDTTANTLAWTLYLLAHNPAALRRAQAEVRAVAGAGGDALRFDHDALDRLDYLDACAHETMRLKPVGPMNLMQALRDTTVGNVAVPTGSMLWCVMRGDTLDARYFPDPESFVPERWREAAAGASATAASARRVSMPFGAGPRICPGRYLALLEMKLVLAMVLDRFDILSVDTDDGDPPAERLSFTMAPVGLRMRLRAYDGHPAPASRSGVPPAPAH